MTEATHDDFYRRFIDSLEAYVILEAHNVLRMASLETWGVNVVETSGDGNWVEEDDEERSFQVTLIPRETEEGWGLTYDDFENEIGTGPGFGIGEGTHWQPEFTENGFEYTVIVDERDVPVMCHQPEDRSWDMKARRE